MRYKNKKIEELKEWLSNPTDEIVTLTEEVNKEELDEYINELYNYVEINTDTGEKIYNRKEQNYYIKIRMVDGKLQMYKGFYDPNRW